jgi:hypothetical protein
MAKTGMSYSEIGATMGEQGYVIRNLLKRYGVYVTRKDVGQSRWQPIETALKDTPILIRKLHEVGIAIHNPSIFGGWQLCSSVSFFQEETQSNMCNKALPLPTHWMPLPQPPKESK